MKHFYLDFKQCCISALKRACMIKNRIWIKLFFIINIYLQLLAYLLLKSQRSIVLCMLKILSFFWCQKTTGQFKLGIRNPDKKRGNQSVIKKCVRLNIHDWSMHYKIRPYIMDRISRDTHCYQAAKLWIIPNPPLVWTTSSSQN